jgi:hypothetical protein
LTQNNFQDRKNDLHQRVSNLLDQAKQYAQSLQTLKEAVRLAMLRGVEIDEDALKAIDAGDAVVKKNLAVIESKMPEVAADDLKKRFSDIATKNPQYLAEVMRKFENKGKIDLNKWATAVLSGKFSIP